MTFEDFQTRLNSRINAAIVAAGSSDIPLEDAIRLYETWGRDTADFFIETRPAALLSRHRFAAEKKAVLAVVRGGIDPIPGMSKDEMDNWRIPPSTKASWRGLLNYGTDRRAPTQSAVESLEVGVSDKYSSGQIVSAAPIISGLSKIAKLSYNPEPFGYYYRAFIDSMIENERLLVIGYGAGDQHLNTWIDQFRKIHDDKRKIVWICWLPGALVGEKTPEKDMISHLAGLGGERSCLLLWNCVDRGDAANFEAAIIGKNGKKFVVRIIKRRVLDAGVAGVVFCGTVADAQSMAALGTNLDHTASIQAGKGPI